MVVLALVFVVGTAALGLFRALALALGDGFLALHGCIVGVRVGRGSGGDVVEGLLVVNSGPWRSGFGGDGVQEGAGEYVDQLTSEAGGGKVSAELGDER